jgi:hypothetical protein
MPVSHAREGTRSDVRRETDPVRSASRPAGGNNMMTRVEASWDKMRRGGTEYATNYPEEAKPVSHFQITGGSPLIREGNVLSRK